MSDPVNPITERTNVTLICIVEISPSVRESDLVALSTLQSTLNVQLLKPESATLLASTGPAISQSSRNFTYTFLLGSFRRTHSGNYSCMANLSYPSYFALAGKTISDTIRVTTGKSNMMSVAICMK